MWKCVNTDTPYLLLVALSGGLPVSMGSSRLRSLDLLKERKEMVQNNTLCKLPCEQNGSSAILNESG